MSRRRTRRGPLGFIILIAIGVIAGVIGFVAALALQGDEVEDSGESAIELVIGFPSDEFLSL